MKTVGAGATGSAFGLAGLTGTAAAHSLRVEFLGCEGVLLVVEDPNEFGQLTGAVDVFDAEVGEIRSVEIELTPENTAPVPGRFDGKPVFRARVSGHDRIVAVETGDGQRFENPNDCARPDPGDSDGGTDQAAFALEQGETCVPLTPLTVEGRTVEEFYGYTPDLDAPNPRQSNTPTNLERPGTSRLFLYDGPQGRSLVIIHGGDDDPGGAASFELSSLPPAGEWVVLDDSHENTEDVFEFEDGRAAMHWAWGAGGRNDGAAFRGLGEEFEVRIDAAFGEDAMREPLDGADLVWQALSGDARDPEVTDLAMDRPVTIRAGGCPSGEPDQDSGDATGGVDARIVDVAVASGSFAPGDRVPADVTVENTGGRSHTFFVGYSAIDPEGRGHHNDRTTDEPVDIEAGETKTHTVDWIVEEGAPPGTYGASVIVWRDRGKDGLETQLDDAFVDAAFEVRT